MTIAERAESLLREILDAPEVLMTPQLRKIARREAKELKTASGEDVLELCDFLIEHGGSGRVRRAEHGAAYESRMVAFDLAWMHKGAFALLDWQALERLGRTLDGWASVDHFARKLSGPAWQRGQITDARVRKWATSSDFWVASNRPGLNHRPQRASPGQRRRRADAGDLRVLPGTTRADLPRQGAQLGAQRVGHPRSRSRHRVHSPARGALSPKSPARSPQQNRNRPQAGEAVRGNATSDARAPQVLTPQNAAVVAAVLHARRPTRQLPRLTSPRRRHREALH